MKSKILLALIIGIATGSLATYFFMGNTSDLQGRLDRTLTTVSEKETSEQVFKDLIELEYNQDLSYDFSSYSEPTTNFILKTWTGMSSEKQNVILNNMTEVQKNGFILELQAVTVGR